MTGPASTAPRLSALRLVSFVPAARDAVHAGLLTPDAAHVIDLAGLGITDALEALDQLPMLRQAAGAIIHGAARVALPVQGLHLVAPLPMARSVVHPEFGDSAPVPESGDSAPIRDVVRDHRIPEALHFADPATLQGPGGHLSRAEAGQAAVGLAAVVGEVIRAGAKPDDETLDAALVGTVLVIGWPRSTDGEPPHLVPGAIGPFLAVPRRQPESLTLTSVAPLDAAGAPDVRHTLPAPPPAAFHALAREAMRTHALQPGDLLTIFPRDVSGLPRPPVAGGSWVRVSAPGLGTLSLAVR